jgi:D-alanine--D-alanine ligase
MRDPNLAVSESDDPPSSAEPPSVGPEPLPGPARVGLLYNLKRIRPTLHGENDDEAEFDGEQTIAAVEAAIASFGHEVVRIEADSSVFERLPRAGIDVAFNIAEGLRGRSREALVPAMLEALGVPFCGSDAAAMVLTLDKGLARSVVAAKGIPVPRGQVFRSHRDPLDPALRFPLFCKPVAEGSSKGVSPAGVVHSELELRQVIAPLVERYRQGVLVEEYLPGREFTVAVLESPGRHTLAPMEIVFTEHAGPFPVYAFAHKQAFGDEVRYDVPAKIDMNLRDRIDAVVLGAFDALGCRDVSRIDVRLDADGEPHFIECNPLPGLTPGWSDLCLIADAAGISYNDVIGRILERGLARAGRALYATGSRWSGDGLVLHA